MIGQLDAPPRLALQRDEILFRQGEHPPHLYRLFSGYIKLSHASLNGRDLIAELLFPGDYFDLHCLLNGGPTSFTASTLFGHPAELECYDPIRLPQSEVVLILQQQLATRTRLQLEMMAALATERVEQRILLALKVMARRGGNPPGLVSMPLTRLELGEMVGTSPESTSRALSDLQRRGILSWKGRDSLQLAEPHLPRPSHQAGVNPTRRTPR